jgi:hypothetical protein
MPSRRKRDVGAQSDAWRDIKVKQAQKTYADLLPNQGSTQSVLKLEIQARIKHVGLLVKVWLVTSVAPQGVWSMGFCICTVDEPRVCRQTRCSHTVLSLTSTLGHIPSRSRSHEAARHVLLEFTRACMYYLDPDRK